MKFTTEQINTYGISATITNFYFPQEGTCRVRVKLESTGEESWYFADPKTHFKGFMKAPQKIIVNPKTKSLLYPNSETHPIETLPELPAELAELGFQPIKA